MRNRIEAMRFLSINKQSIFRNTWHRYCYVWVTYR